MSFTTDANARQVFITGLRDLADYLASHPALAVPAHGTEILLSANSADDGGCAQVDRFARQLGISVCDHRADTGLYWSGRFFGTVGYVMSTASNDQMARHRAEASYADCVIPDAQPDTWT